MTYPEKVLCAVCRGRDHEDVVMDVKFEFKGEPHPIEPNNGFRIYKCPECGHEAAYHLVHGPMRVL